MSKRGSNHRPSLPRFAWSVPEFCESHGISRSLLYILLRDGRGPAVMRIGGRTLISIEAAETWRRAMEATSREVA